MLNVLVAQSDWAILVLRLILGVIFMAHGWKKIKSFSGFTGWLESMGFKPGWFWGSLVTAAEFGGGLLILTGFFTQLAALILTISMMVALSVRMRNKDPFIGGYELDLALIGALLVLTTLGNGFFAFNNVLGF